MLADTRTPQRRLRDLPSRVGVYFVLALCLFPGLGYRKVWPTLTATTRSPKAAVGQGVAGFASSPWGGTVEGAVRNAGRTGGRTAHCRGAVRALPHCRVRRVCVVQGRRHRPQPILVGQAQGLPMVSPAIRW